MPVIVPIRDLEDTAKISKLAHEKREPIFVTKNGYSDLVIMSAELYDYYAQIYKIDRIIDNSEKEVEEGARPLSYNDAKKMLDKKYYG